MLERRYGLPSDEQGEVQLGRLDEEDFLRWYTRFMDSSWLSSFGKRGPFPNEFVRCSDHGCVEYINVQLSTLKHGGISTEEFESKMRRLEERVIANMELRPSQLPFKRVRSPTRQRDVSEAGQAACPVRRETNSVPRSRWPICTGYAG